MRARPLRFILVLALLAGCLAAAWFIWRSVSARSQRPDPEAAVGPDAFDPPTDAAAPAAAPALSGLVVDEQGQGIAGATVVADCGESQPAVTVARQGAFEFAELPPGECRITATAPTHVAAGPAPEATAQVRIRAGAALTGLQLPLYRQAVVSGTVRAGEQPVEGATLSVLYLEAPAGVIQVTGGPYSISVEARSGPDGAYRIERLAPGRIQVLAEHEEWGLAESEERFVQAGDRLDGLDVTLQDSGRLSGRVVDAQARPVVGAEVALVRENSVRREAAITDDDGTFTFPTVAVGAVTVTAAAHGLQPARQDDVIISASEVTDVTLQLSPRPGFGGVVRAPDGQPLPRAAVYVRRAGTDRTDGGAPLAISDEQGLFWITEAPPPPSVAWARHREYAPSSDQPVGGSERDLTLTLQPGGRLVGQVVDTEGRPVSVFTVTARQAFQGGHSQPVRDPSGQFAVPVEPGRYAVFVSAPGKPDVETRRFLVRAGRDTDVGRIVLGEGGAVSGRAVDEETGEPLAGVQVRADSSRRGRTVTTGADGEFLLDGLPAATTSLSLNARGRVQRLVPSVAVEDGEVRRLGDIALRRGGSGSMQYTGVGISIRFEDDRILLNEAFEGGPAARAGLTADTAIVAVNGRPVSELTPNQVVQLIRGEAGTDVTLDVLLPDAAYPETMRIERGEVTATRL